MLDHSTAHMTLNKNKLDHSTIGIKRKLLQVTSFCSILYISKEEENHKINDNFSVKHAQPAEEHNHYDNNAVGEPMR